MRRINKKEQGQVLVLLTMGMITLLGFASLAIDGGRLYSEKRVIQGVADTSSLTGALYIGHHEGAITSNVENTAIAVALSRAASNGYSANVDVTIDRDGPYYIVTTIIESELDPVIAQLIYNGPFSVAVKSVARVYRVEEFAVGAALYSMSPDQKNALEFTGDGNVTIEGTGIYSNSNHSTHSINFSGSSTSILGEVISTNGGINFGADVDYPGVNQVEEAWGYYTVPKPVCSGLPAGTRSVSGGVVTFTPGVYYSGISENGHFDYFFEPGFYCIYNGFSTKNGNFDAFDVSFYVPTGDVSFGGTVNFVASMNYDDPVVDAAGQIWNGMLLYIANGKLTINGNADSDYTGTIFVPTPGNPSCKLNGTSDSDGFNMQLVCDSININGTGDLVLFFDKSVSYIPPVQIDLFE